MNAAAQMSRRTRASGWRRSERRPSSPGAGPSTAGSPPTARRRAACWRRARPGSCRCAFRTAPPDRAGDTPTRRRKAREPEHADRERLILEQREHRWLGGQREAEVPITAATSRPAPPSLNHNSPIVRPRATTSAPSMASATVSDGPSSLSAQAIVTAPRATASACKLARRSGPRSHHASPHVPRQWPGSPSAPRPAPRSRAPGRRQPSARSRSDATARRRAARAAVVGEIASSCASKWSA